MQSLTPRGEKQTHINHAMPVLYAPEKLIRTKASLDSNNRDRFEFNFQAGNRQFGCADRC
ncbi:hypothetical protein Mal52_40080 [Symmachiella dynata]|uniref:Uncharacterized protein n=1 Tax=Symmachiella dynata TaxID=2527995 RepID=A0A517ZSU1_9PLAN|nr:hypothetical protein Mal52_40080 [Symmachiella dynata]